MKNSFIICDHYVLNNQRSQFLYSVIKPTKCFALTKKFIQKRIFPKYPEIASQMKADALFRYNKRKQTLLRFKQQALNEMNKKSIYSTIEIKPREESKEEEFDKYILTTKKAKE